MLKVKASRKGRPKNDAKDSTQTQRFFRSLFSQLKSDDIPSEVKLGGVNNTDINQHITLCCCNSYREILEKPIKVLKCKYSFCLNCLAACLSGENEEESQCPVCKINILKTDISPSSGLQNLLSLLKIQCKRCSKKLLISTHYNHYTKHIQNCSLDISPPSSPLVSDILQQHPISVSIKWHVNGQVMIQWLRLLHFNRIFQIRKVTSKFVQLCGVTLTICRRT